MLNTLVIYFSVTGRIFNLILTVGFVALFALFHDVYSKWKAAGYNDQYYARIAIIVYKSVSVLISFCGKHVAVLCLQMPVELFGLATWI